VVNGYKQSPYYQDIYLFDLKTKSITKGQSILDLERNYTNFMYDGVNNKCIWVNQDFHETTAKIGVNTFDNTLTTAGVTHSALSAATTGGETDIASSGLDVLFSGETGTVAMDSTNAHLLDDGIIVSIDDTEADNAHTGNYKVFTRDADEFFFPSGSTETNHNGDVIISSFYPQGVYLETKHLDFGSPNVRKKVYSIAISHKGSAAKLKLQYQITNNSGTGDWTDAAALTDYDDYQRQVFSISANNIYTIGFRIVANTSGVVLVPYDFAINDMGIVYRAKNVK